MIKLYLLKCINVVIYYFKYDLFFCYQEVGVIEMFCCIVFYFGEGFY